ncbi:hypothetical protein HELRODRAFT_186226 [Helobdella robusta]|uniref:Reticulocalbin-3 n=1 Tax=Helobdella robusta TaxID=6412 RepID=T1FNU3_HELRO|nr:hypothetical protein HELRODRAFT_186226 [Helobdella robusta]ESN89992.1 hypothetical protein HELRODRAFT_186226 [Helobdella robusta]
MMIIFIFLLVTSTLVRSSVIPQDVRSRVIDLQPPPLNEDRQEYDHEAFLGKDQVKHFDHLTPEESKKRLGIIFEKIDNDANGKLTEKELHDWIEYVQLRFIRKNVEEQWSTFKGGEHGTIRWGQYKEKVYGQLEDEEDERPNFRFGPQMKRDLRRWQQADRDKNGHLSIDEFTDFLHPEEANHMKELVVQETIEDIDKDNDGKISIEEYIKDLWSQDGQEPDWLAGEREVFREVRDKNKDGFLDNEEVKIWILPEQYDHIMAETKHLMFASDEDRDGVLSKEEVLLNFEVFVGSQATDFGDAIDNHDEF